MRNQVTFVLYCDCKSKKFKISTQFQITYKIITLLKLIHLTFLCVLFSFQFKAQDSIQPKLEKYTAHNKGKFYIYWGGNRDSYTDSSLRIKGDGYNFVLHDLKSLKKR